MASTLRQDVDFSGLFRKLGHSLEEIRVRSLQNILSKLEYKLICEVDLVHERHLLIRLLEWFNFTPCSMQKEVLTLLLTLAKHNSAAEILLSVGGLDFLTKLRQNCAISDQPMVDQLMECLMRLPNDGCESPECFYQIHDHPQQGPLSSEIKQNEQQHPPYQGPHKSSQQIYYPIRDETSPRDTAHHDNKDAVPVFGYFTSVSQSEPVPSPNDCITVLPKCFKMTTFPWLPLTSTDRHVLASTNSSLQSSDRTLLTSACEFLSDVVFQDFPAEVFLQRPTILKSLLSLLSASSADAEQLSSQTTQTLTDLARSLRTRLLFYQDPVLYSPKQDFNFGRASLYSSRNSSNQSLHSIEPRPPAIGHSGRRHRGDGRDQDSSNGSMSGSGSHSSLLADPEETDIDEMNSLQLMSLTLPQITVFTLDSCLPLLKTSSTSVVSGVSLLLSETIGLLSDSITSFIWEDNTPATREIVEKLEQIFEKIGDLLQFHHHMNWCHGPQRETTQMRKETEHHRVTYLSLCCCLRKLLNAIVPVSEACSVLPDILIKALSDLVFDASFSQAYPSLHDFFLSYIEVTCPEKYRDYRRAVTVCHSLHKSCQFLLEFHPTGPLSNYLDLGLESVVSLPYHRHIQLVEQLILLSSLLCVDNSDCSFQPLMLQLLSHPMEEIRVKAYQSSYKIISTSLSVEAAADPLSSAASHCHFLLDTQILQDIIYCGLADSNNEVHDLSVLMLTHLLQSELLMSGELWKIFLASLLPVLPVLQGYTEIQSSLGSCIMSLIEPEMKDKDTRLPPLERLRGWLRLMLSSDTKCRAESLKRLAWFLSHEEASTLKLPSFTDLDVTNITNLFIVKSQRTVEEEDGGQTLFKVEGMQKVYGIFVSETVEPSVRKSAIDQLSIILQDPCLHTSFLKEGGLEKVLDVLYQGVCKGDNNLKENYTVYVPACLSILRHLIHSSTSLRHRLAHQAPIYYAVLRGALLFHENPMICYEASHLLTLLLFDETAIFQIRSSSNNFTQKQHKALSLPAPVTKRFHLPFKTAIHYDRSPHQVSIVEESDPLLSGMGAEMLRVTWNIAWHGGMEKLTASLKNLTSYNKSAKGYPPHLCLSSTESVVILRTEPRRSLEQCLYEISNATSHEDVKEALSTLTTHIATRPTAHLLIHQLDWHHILNRFLCTLPSSTSDDILLFEVLQFVTMLLKSSNQIPVNILQWLVKTVYQPSGPLIGLLSRSHGSLEGDVHVRRQLDRELLSFITAYSRQLPSNLINKLDVGQLRGNLSHKLLLRLNVAEAPHFYNLAMLEGTLNCLMTITARAGWSVECTELDSTTLCSQLLNSLLEVVSAFHIGRGGTSMSFMGKGVTKAATLCLRQLAYEMATSTNDTEWPKNWLYSRQGNDAVPEPGLNWMLTLWAYRDPVVRAAGLGISVALTSTGPGRVMLTSNCKHIPGGMWGAAFSILLDQSECSMVRQQAAMLLVNLTSESLTSGCHANTDPSPNHWQGPIVTDTQFQVSLVGLPALLALLQHSQFYQELLVMCENFFPQPAIHPVTLQSDHQTTSQSSQTTITTLESNPVHRSATGYTDRRTHFTSTPSEAMLNEHHISTRGHVTSQSRHTPGTTTTVSTPTFGVDLGVEMSASSLPDSQGSEEYQGVTTPSLIAAVANLMRNLVLLAPQDTLMVLKQHSLLHTLYSLPDVGLLQVFCLELSKERPVLRNELVFEDLLDMTTSILDLTRVCLHSSKSLAHTDSVNLMEAIREQDLFQLPCQLCGLSIPPSSLRHSHKLQLAIYTLFAYVLTHSPYKLKLSAVTAIRQNWDIIMSNVSQILSNKGEDNSSLYVQCLQFIAVLLSTEAKLTSLASISWRALLDQKVDGSHGSVLCEHLLRVYERHTLSNNIQNNPRERSLVVNCFRLVLGLSYTAKSVALKAGLVESLVKHLEELVKKLHTQHGGILKQKGKKKEDPTITEIISVMDLLKNFMYEDTNVKRAANHSNLANVVHYTWAWCLTNPDLMTSALSLLTTFTARYLPGCMSLACTNPHALGVSTVTKSVLTSNSMVHTLIKLAQAELEKSSICRAKAVFTLLKTLALSTECRNILWKSNFLNEFSNLNPRKQKKSKYRQCLDGLWLELLLNLSFSTDGQNIICKIKDCITLLLEFGEGHSVCHETSLLILRNLCFHTANKPKLLANELFVPFLLDCLCEESWRERCVSASALYALASNNQKARVVLKNASITVKAKQVLSNCVQRTDSTDRMYSRCVENLEGLLTVIAD